MRVLVLNQHYWPEVAATAQILSDICEDLVSAGHEVRVLTAQPSYREVAGAARKLPALESHLGVEIHRGWSYRPSERSIPRRVAHYGSFFATSLLSALRTERPDVVLVLSTPPLLLGLSGALIQAARHVPFVYSVQDLYPDIALNLGVLKPGPFATGVGMVANALYRSAAAVITLSEGMAARLREKGVKRVEVIPNWADTDAIRPMARDNEFARAHGLAGRFVVQYSGNVGLSQGLEHLPAAAELLRDRDVHFAVVGGGNAREALEADVRRRKLENVTFIDPQPRDRLPELLASCDVGFVPMRRGIGADLVPSKLYGIMAAGRAVLASTENETEVARVIRKYDCGVVVAPEDPEALVAGVSGVREHGGRLNEMGQLGRKAAVDEFSREVCAAKYGVTMREVAA